MSALNIVHGVQFKVTENQALEALEAMLKKAVELQEQLNKALDLNNSEVTDRVKSLSDALNTLKKNAKEAQNVLSGGKRGGGKSQDQKDYDDHQKIIKQKYNDEVKLQKDVINQQKESSKQILSIKQDQANKEKAILDGKAKAWAEYEKQQAQASRQNAKLEQESVKQIAQHWDSLYKMQQQNSQKTAAEKQKQLKAEEDFNNKMLKLMLDRQKANDKFQKKDTETSMARGTKAIEEQNKRLQEQSSFLGQIENQIEELVALRRKVDVLDPNAEQKIMSYTRQLTNLRRQMTNLTTVSGIGGGLTGFQFAVSQVLRETPTLLYSVQTYILAISNNLPILADEFSNLKGTGESALKGIIRAFTSLSGIMIVATLGVQLLLKWIEQIDQEATEAAEAVNQLNKELKEIGKNTQIKISTEMAKFSRLVKAAKDDTDDHNYALKALNDEYAKGITELKDIKDLNEDVLEVMQKQIKARIALSQAEQYAETLIKKKIELDRKRQAGPTIMKTLQYAGEFLIDPVKWTTFGGAGAGKRYIQSRFMEGINAEDASIKKQEEALNSIFDKILKEIISPVGGSGSGGGSGNNMTDLLTDLLIDLQKLNNEISGSGFLTDMQTALDISAKHTRDWEVEMSELNKEIAKANELHKEGKLLYPEQTFAAFEAIKAQKEMLKVIKERIELEKQAQRTTLDGLDLVTQKIDLIIARQKKRNEAIKNGSSQGDLLDGNIRLFTSEAMREDANDIADLTTDLFKLTNQIKDLEEKARRAGKSVREITTGDEFDNYETIKNKIIPSIRENIDLIQAQSDARYGVATAEAVMDWIGMAQAGNEAGGRAQNVQTELQGIRAMQGASRLFGGRQRLAWRMQKELMQNNINVASRNLDTSRAGVTELEERRSTGINIPEEQMLRAKEKVAEDELALEKANLERDDAMYNHKIETLNTYLDAYSEMANQIVSIANMMADAQIAALDREIAARQNSIDYAVRLAERGNTDLINEEREMLRQSMAEREKMARKQMAINTALMISESLVAVAKAAAQGGGIGSALTIAAAVAAMAAGVISVVSLANDSKPGFYDGGYTGDGNPREVAGVVHKQEVVFNHKDVARLGGKDVVESIRKGNLPVAISPFAVGGQDGRVEALENKLDEVIEAVRESKLQQSIFFNEHGVGIMAQKAIVNDARRFARR